MRKHKYAPMIKARAHNMDLVVFVKCTSSWKVQICNEDQLNFSEGHDYFICLPQHKEACHHWLNGGEVQVLHSPGHEWVDMKSYNREPKWHGNSDFMNLECQTRIKPRKEKRWICITNDLEIEDGTLYESYADAEENSPGYKQIVEIEVEV